jgi:hypothetical protein
MSIFCYQQNEQYIYWITGNEKGEKVGKKKRVVSD